MSQIQESTNLTPFRLGDWEVRPNEGVLCSGGRSVRLEPRVMDVLVHLAASPERVVSKEELLTEVWGGSFVEEGALTQAIHSLRKALGDDAKKPRFIQTVPKRGYRLVGGLEARKSEPTIQDLPRPVLPATVSPRLLVPGRSGPVIPLSARLLGSILLIGAMVWIGWGRSGDPRPKIVVIPFDNLAGPEEAYFADGLTEELTKDLYSVKGVRVISRTSARMYAHARKPVSQIGEELGVAYVLEGAVRWARGSGGRRKVRINSQLIRVEDDVQVWADVFEREVEDIFKVQEEISRNVIEALNITLVPSESGDAHPRPTENLDAYRAYLRGLQIKNQDAYSAENLRRAAPLFERAVALDPSFAVAWAELSQVHSYLAFNHDGLPDERERSWSALNRATALAPDLPEVRVAQAYFTYRCLGDLSAAVDQFTAAGRLYPNDAGIHQSLGYVLRRLGRFDEAVGAFQEAAALDPLSSDTFWSLGETYRARRAYGLADQAFRQAASMIPDEPYYRKELVLNRLAWKGDVQEARRLLREAPIPSDPRLAAVSFMLDFYQRDYQRALSRFTAEEIQKLPTPEPSQISMLSAVALERLGKPVEARAAAESNRAALEARLALYPNEALTRAYLAVALAQLARGAEAQVEIERAAQLKEGDFFTGPSIQELHAIVEMYGGHRREAIDRLSRLRASFYRSSINAVEIRLDPVWDPLRADPGFGKLAK